VRERAETKPESKGGFFLDWGVNKL